MLKELGLGCNFGAGYQNLPYPHVGVVEVSETSGFRECIVPLTVYEKLNSCGVDGSLPGHRKQ